MQTKKVICTDINLAYLAYLKTKFKSDFVMNNVTE